MRNVLDKSSREYQNTHFMLNNLFSENSTFYEIMSKNMVDSEGIQMTSQYGSRASHAGLARLYEHTCIRMHTSMLSGIHMHARPRMQTQTNM
jgi:hypothetical protein